MDRKEWEEGFEQEEKEILALIQRAGGAGKINDFWEASVYFLAYVDCKTGVLYPGEGRLVYPVSDEEKKQSGIPGRFKEKTIYRVKVRAKKQEDTPEGITKSSQNRLFVLEILDESASCPELDEILAEYDRPIVLDDEILGELTLNKEFAWFEGSVSWRGAMIDVNLEVDKDDESSWSKVINAMKNMLSEQDNWDKEMRSFATKKLTALACEWRDSADEPVPEITEQSFSERIALNSIVMTEEGNFYAYFDDDDMFFGHSVTVYGTLNDGITSAAIEG